MTTEQNPNAIHQSTPQPSRQESSKDPLIESKSMELELPVFLYEELNKFIPNDFPQFLKKNQRIPLRRQIFNDKKILRTVLTKPKKGVYMCNHCDKIFNTFGELLDHFDEFDVSRPHKCSVDDCPWKIVGFNKVRQLHRHEKSVHSTEKDYKCQVPNCNKKFGRIDLLNRHIKSVHENKKSRFNKKMSRESSSTIITTDTPSYQSSNDELSGGEISPIVSSSSSLINPPPTQQQNPDQQQRRGSQYKHTIKFLTNSDD